MKMAKVLLISTIVASTIVTMSLPTVVLGCFRHGSVFTPVGDIQKVPENSETDPELGIVVTEIDSDAKTDTGIMVPMAAVMDI